MVKQVICATVREVNPVYTSQCLGPQILAIKEISPNMAQVSLIRQHHNCTRCCLPSGSVVDSSLGHSAIPESQPHIVDGVHGKTTESCEHEPTAFFCCKLGWESYNVGYCDDEEGIW